MMISEKMDDMMMVFNDCYPVEAYKKHYLTARMIQCDAEKFQASNEDDVEKCMWIYTIFLDLKDVPAGRVEHTFDYKEISFDSAKFIRKAFPRKKKWDSWMSLLSYDIAYNSMHYMVPDADGFGLFDHIREKDIEKCKWIAAIYEVIADVVEKYVNPIFAELDIQYDWEEFYYTRICYDCE